MMQRQPYILTLQINAEAFAFFNDLRQQHFPLAINYLAAHLTLFHHLPLMATVTELLQTVAAQQLSIDLEITNLMKLGRGVAYQVKSEELLQLQSYLKKQWQPWLTPQDQQGFRPHITVQNKVTPEKAQALFIQLANNFQPFPAVGTGLSLWEYQGGPWLKIKDYEFLAGD